MTDTQVMAALEPTHVNIEKLRDLLAKATPGPWEIDSEYDGDGHASGGGGCTTGWHNYFVGADIDGKWRTLLDTVNSDHKLIEDDRDEEGGRSWDAIGEANVNLVAAAINALPHLLDELARHRLASSPAATLPDCIVNGDVEAWLFSHPDRDGDMEAGRLELFNFRMGYAAPVTPPAGDAEELACLFCSGFSVVRQDDDPGYPFYVTFEHTAECPSYAVPTDLFKSYRTEAEAIAAWTSRPSIPTSPVNSGNILVSGQEYVPLEAYREAMAGWKASNALAPVAGDAALRKALEWYADPDNWADVYCAEPDAPMSSDWSGGEWFIGKHPGSRARAALATPPSVPAQQGEAVEAVRQSMDSAVAQVAADAIRASFFTSVSGSGRYWLSLAYPTMDAMHKAEDEIKAFIRWPRFLPLDQRLAVLGKQGWQDMATAPRDGTEFVAAIKVRHLRGGMWWERHVIAFDDDVTGNVGSDYCHGWAFDDYELWMPLADLPPLPATPPSQDQKGVEG